MYLKGKKGVIMGLANDHSIAWGIAKKLSEEGADFNSVDYRGRAPIHIASISGNLEAVRYLLDQSVNLDMIDNSGQSSLFYACINRHEKIVDLLVEKGATVIKD